MASATRYLPTSQVVVIGSKCDGPDTGTLHAWDLALRGPSFLRLPSYVVDGHIIQSLAQSPHCFAGLLMFFFLS